LLFVRLARETSKAIATAAVVFRIALGRDARRAANRQGKRQSACDEKRLYGSDGRTLLAGCHVSSREIKYSVSVGTAISVAAPDDGIYIEDVYPSWATRRLDAYEPKF
jgi:hypothetical protein